MFAHSLVSLNFTNLWYANECRFYWRNVKVSPSEKNATCVALCTEAMNVFLSEGVDLDDMRMNYPIPINSPLQIPELCGDRNKSAVPSIVREMKVVAEEDFEKYFNSIEFREALHVPSYVTQEYTYFSDKVGNLYTTPVEGSVWIYDILKLYGYQVLFFEGDTDGAISLPGSYQWIKNRNYNLVKGWNAIQTDDGQLFGYSKEYDLFKLVTIHGFGHSAYFQQGKYVTRMIARFVHGLSLQ